MGSVLITGGGGYIGSVLAEQLLSQEHTVTIFDRFFFGQDLLGPLRSQSELTLIRGDTRSIEPEMFHGVSAVIHLAALSSDPACDLNPDLTEDINLLGTIRVAKLAKAAGVPRLIFSSSCSVYGAGEGPEALTEQSPTRPVSLYATLKLAAERELLSMADEGFCVIVLRNATVYGTSYRMRFDLVVNLMTLHALMKRKVYILGGGKQWRPNVHVRDVARAFITVLQAPSEVVVGQIFNVGSDEQNLQVGRLARVVCDVIPYSEVETAPDDADKRTYKVGFEKIARTLDFRAAHQIRGGIEEVLEALRRGDIDDDIRTYTVRFYRHLMEAERLVDELSYNGRILGRLPHVKSVPAATLMPVSALSLPHRSISAKRTGTAGRH